MIRILTVCTGNICRSPYAELFLQSELNRIAPESFRIRSAGTHALVGHRMDATSSMKLRDIDVSSDDFLARQLSERNLSGNDLVLAMTDEHRSSIVAMSPRLLKRTYTLREFAAVLDELAAMPDGTLPKGSGTAIVSARWAAVIKSAQLERYTARTKIKGNLDVIDPYRRSENAYQQMVDEMLPALRTIVKFEYLHAAE